MRGYVWWCAAASSALVAYFAVLPFGAMKMEAERAVAEKGIFSEGAHFAWRHCPQGLGWRYDYHGQHACCTEYRYDGAQWVKQAEAHEAHGMACVGGIFQTTVIEEDGR